MNDDTSPRRDERRVIDELERLRDAIKSTRSRREEAEAQFAGYLEKFRPASESVSKPGPEQSPAIVPYRREPADAGAGQAPQAGGRWETLFAEEPSGRRPAAVVAPVRPHNPVVVKPSTPVRAVDPVPTPAPVEARPVRAFQGPPSEESTSAGPVATAKDGSADDPMAEIMRRLRPEPGEEAAAAASPAPAPVLTSPPSTTSRMPVMVALAAVVLLALVGGWALFSRSGDGAGPAQEARAAVEPAAAPVEAPAAGPVTPTPAAAPEPPPPPAPLRIVVRTTRHVWLRLIVDGDLRLEKEVPAGERFPLGAQQTVVIRAGDAGAVTVEIDGRPAEPLGSDGQVLTRRFAPQ